MNNVCIGEMYRLCFPSHHFFLPSFHPFFLSFFPSLLFRFLLFLFLPISSPIDPTAAVTMVFRPTYEYVDQRALMSSALDVSTVPYFQAAVTIRVPEQPIWYTPSVTQVLKFAWIQYMSIFILVSFLLFRLNSFVFSHQLVSSYPAADVVYEKMD